MYEMRKEERQSMCHLLEVYETDTGDSLGYLVDITTGGLRLMSVKPMIAGMRFRMSLWPEIRPGVRDQIQIEAETVSESQTSIGSYYETGFKIIFAEDDTVESLQELIRRQHADQERQQTEEAETKAAANDAPTPKPEPGIGTADTWVPDEDDA